MFPVESGNKATRVLFLALCVSFLGAVPVLASAAEPIDGGAPLQLRVVDGNGQPIPGTLVRVLRDRRGAKVAGDASGLLDVPVAPGDKLTLKAEGPAGRYTTRSFVVPAEAAGVVDIVLSLAGAGGQTVQEATNIALGETLSGNTAIDGARATDPYCGFDVTAPGLWFITTGTGGPMTVSTCNQAEYDTKLSVFINLSQCNAPDLICEGTNDDAAGCSGFTSSLTWQSQPGLPYAILVHGFSDDAGAFDLTVSDGSADDVSSAAFVPPPLGICCTCLDSPFNCRLQTSQGECLEFGGDWMPYCLDCRPVYHSSAPGLAVPDNGFPDVVTDSIYISGGTIEDVDVFIRTFHSWIGDLHHVLVSPSGTRVTLWNGACDDGPYSGLEADFDDDGTAQMCNPDGPTPSPDDGNGRIRPQGGAPLAAFNGASAEGLWTLESSDDFPGDAGTLLAWSVRINNEAPRTVCDPPDTPGSATGQFTICHCLPNGQCQTRTLPSHVANRHLLNHGADSLGACE